MWLKLVQRMDTDRLPNQALKYKQKGLQHVEMMDTNRLKKEALQYKISGYKMYRGWTQTY